MKNKIFIIILILLLFACKKETDSPTGSNKIDIGNTSIDSVSYFQARVSTALISTGGNDISQHGHCWSKAEQPTVDDMHSSLGSVVNPKTFTSNLADLEPNTTYYIRAYASTSGSTIYGDQHSLTTLKTGKPVVQTGNFYAPDISSAYGEGLAVADSGLAIIQKGFCWSTDINPSLTNNMGYSQEGPGLGGFADTLSGLSEGTDYYVVAYATNEKGTSYGEINGFQTIPITLPTVTTSGISQLTPTSAVAGGKVDDDGNGTIMARGVCWDLQPDPSLINNIGYTNDGTGTGEFESDMTWQTVDTTYYYTAYATNEKGTAYGEVKDFMTSLPCGELTVDYSGQLYHTVLIGNQCWMKENLNIGTRINGIQEQTDNGSIEKYCYGDNEANCDEYGGLYQWDEMMQYVSQEGVQGICPDGWHIPTDEEWKILEGTVDSQYGVGNPEWDQTEFRGYDAAIKLKSTFGWYNNGNGTDLYGFTALPGGIRSGDGYFYDLILYGYFWTSAGHNEAKAWNRLFFYDYDIGAVYRYPDGKILGFSVRCVKD